MKTIIREELENKAMSIRAASGREQVIQVLSYGFV